MDYIKEMESRMGNPNNWQNLIKKVTMPSSTKETDADLEKFIEQVMTDGGATSIYGAYDSNDVKSIAQKVAAFADKRAREKAIEEYQEKLKSLANLRLEVGGLNDITAMALNMAYDILKELKSL